MSVKKTCVTQNFHCIKPETRVPIKTASVSPLPSSASRPLPDTDLDVFFREVGRVKEVSAGWRRTTSFCFQAGSDSDGSSGSPPSYFFSPYSPMLVATSRSAGFTMTRPSSLTSIGLILLLIAFTAAGKGCSWVCVRWEDRGVTGHAVLRCMHRDTHVCVHAHMKAAHSPTHGCVCVFRDFQNICY